MRTTVLLSSLLFAGMASAQLFTSGFENWTDSVPDGWEGVKTNIPLSQVSKVTNSAHSGSLSVRLENTSDSHKRFTTTALTVADGQNYTISFWVRGSGDIRTAIYDGRSTGSGYSSYNAYVQATDTWTEVTQTVAAGNDTTGAEFIISVRNTVAPDHLEVDDVTISNAGALVPVSIYDIQYTTDASGDSPYNGQTVLTGGIVTAALPGGGYFVQSGSGPWTGVYVYDTDNTPAIGDSVTFSASVSEYFNLTELGGVSGYTVVSTGNDPPAALDVQTGEVALEPLESVLVRVVNAGCTEAPSGANFGKYTVDDGSGGAVIGKEIYTTDPEPTVGQVMTVTGVVYYSFSEYDIEPRMTSDVDFTTGIADAGVLSGVSFGPNPATDVVKVSLGQAAGSFTYTLTDMQGRTVQSGQLSQGRSLVDVNNVANGLYHFTLRNEAAVKTSAIEVAH